MNKRTKFVITSLLLTFGFAAINYINNYRFWGIAGLTIFTTILFYWSLKDGLGKNATLLTLVLPSLFTLTVGLFWFLLPSTLIAQVPFLLIYALGIYSLCLTANIFTVSIVRTIALSRAAKSVSFVLTLFTSFLLFDVLLSFRESPILTTLGIFALSFPLFVQGLWSSKLSTNISKDIIFYSISFSYCLASVFILQTFWPVTLATGSIFLTSVSYVLLGLGQSKLEERLFKQTIREYLIVGIAVFVTMLFSTSWRG